MPSASKIRLGGKTVGWNVWFSHTETEAIALNPASLPALLRGVAGPKVAPILMTLPRQTWRVTCITGGHDGVKAVVSFYPPAAVLFPR